MGTSGSCSPLTLPSPRPQPAPAREDLPLGSSGCHLKQRCCPPRSLGSSFFQTGRPVEGALLFEKPPWHFGIRENLPRGRLEAKRMGPSTG